MTCIIYLNYTDHLEPTLLLASKTDSEGMGIKHNETARNIFDPTFFELQKLHFTKG